MQRFNQWFVQLNGLFGIVVVRVLLSSSLAVVYLRGALPHCTGDRCRVRTTQSIIPLRSCSERATFKFVSINPD